MKICDVVRLCKTYGDNTTLAELQKEIQGNKIHKCPKCSGTGKITKKRSTGNVAMITSITMWNATFATDKDIQNICINLK